MATTPRPTALILLVTALLTALVCCDAAEPPSGPAATAHYIWIDPDSPPGDLEADSIACHQWIRQDAWAQTLDVFNRAILVQGCMQKKGWDPPGPASGAPRR